MSGHRRFAHALLAGLALAAAACSGTPPSRYYLLDAPPAATAPVAGPLIFVDRVSVVAYADRSQLVTRADGGQVLFEEFDVWAEPIGDQITRTLIDALGARFGYERVMMTPLRRPFDADFRLAVDVLRLHADSAGGVTFDARWLLFADAGERFVDTGRERIVQAAPAGDIAARVAAINGAIATFADRVIAVIERTRRR